MQKSLLVLGLAMLIVAAGVFALFVLPQIGGVSASVGTSGLSLLAVAVSSLGLAAGAALVGIGLGRWQRPRSSPHDGSPEI